MEFYRLEGDLGIWGLILPDLPCRDAIYRVSTPYLPNSPVFWFLRFTLQTVSQRSRLFLFGITIILRINEFDGQKAIQRDVNLRC